MLCPPISVNQNTPFEEELRGDTFKDDGHEKEEEEEDKELSCIDRVMYFLKTNFSVYMYIAILS